MKRLALVVVPIMLLLAVVEASGQGLSPDERGGLKVEPGAVFEPLNYWQMVRLGATGLEAVSKPSKGHCCGFRETPKAGGKWPLRHRRRTVKDALEPLG